MKSMVLTLSFVMMASVNVRAEEAAAPAAEAAAPAEHKIHKDHDHKHGKKCGHKAKKHGDHTDYQHDGHKHKADGDHVDECEG